MKNLSNRNELRILVVKFQESVHSQRSKILSKLQNQIKKITIYWVHDSSKLPLHAVDICTFQDRLSSKMRDYQKYALIKNFFKPDQYFSYRFTERNFVFSWINTFPWLCYSRIEDGAYCLQCALFGTTYPGKKLPNFFSKTYRDWRHALTSFRSHQSVSCKMHQQRMSTYNKFLQEYNKKSLPINKRMHENYQVNVSLDETHLDTVRVLFA